MTALRLEPQLNRMLGNEQEARLAKAALLRFGSEAELRLVRVDEAWVRRGAETYSWIFSLTHASGAKWPLIMKAAVPFSFGIPIAETVNEWFARRAALRKLGHFVPDVHYRGVAVWIEDFLPLDWPTLVSLAATDRILSGRITELHKALTSLGFSLESVQSDIRGTMHKQPMLVDFGWDLGPISQEKRQGIDRTIGGSDASKAASATP